MKYGRVFELTSRKFARRRFRDYFALQNKQRLAKSRECDDRVGFEGLVISQGNARSHAIHEIQSPPVDTQAIQTDLDVQQATYPEPAANAAPYHGTTKGQNRDSDSEEERLPGLIGSDDEAKGDEVELEEVKAKAKAECTETTARESAAESFPAHEVDAVLCDKGITKEKAKAHEETRAPRASCSGHNLHATQFKSTVWAESALTTTSWFEEGYLRWKRSNPQSSQEEFPLAKQRQSKWKHRGKRGGTRGGAKRHRGHNPRRDTEHLFIFFANITTYSDHAKFFISGRDEDVILLAETHQNRRDTLSMVKEFGKMGWTATASPAELSDRSEVGTNAGVLAAVAPHVDNRPSSICVDTQGQLTDNAYIAARTLTIEMVEMQALAGYMECSGLKRPQPSNSLGGRPCDKRRPRLVRLGP